MNARDELTLCRVHGGFTGRVTGSTLGLPIEGKTHEYIKKTHGYMNDFVGIKVNKDGVFDGVINDDELYEIILLLALQKKGTKLTSMDVAKEWLARLEGFKLVFTAERIALQRFRENTFLFGDDLIPGNEFYDYIGAQMRGEMPGWIHPGNMAAAVDLAITDASVSHAREGIAGEAFVSAMVAGAFLIPADRVHGETVDADDLTGLIERAMESIPRPGKYIDVLHRARELHDARPVDWERNFVEFKEYAEGDLFDSLYEGSDDKRKNELLKSYFVHVLPNAGIIMLALLHSNGSFSEALKISAGCGMDADCNCGNVGGIFGTIIGQENIPLKWKRPINNTFLTLVRGWEEDRIDVIARMIHETSTGIGR